MNLSSIYLPTDILLELYENVKKLYYSEISIDIEIFYEHVLNLYLANDSLKIRDDIFSNCGYFDYYGAGGSFKTVSFLYTSARYSNIDTFKRMLSEFKDISNDNALTDNHYTLHDDLPDDILPQMLNTFESHKVMEKYIKYNGTRLSTLSGDVVSINRLIKLSMQNPNGEAIRKSLLELKDHKLYSYYWPFADEFDESLLELAHKVEGLFGESESGQFLAVLNPGKICRSLTKSDLERILSSTHILDIKVHKFIT